jgi:hypothetical protein
MAGFERLTAQHVAAGTEKQAQQTQTQTQMQTGDQHEGCNG